MHIENVKLVQVRKCNPIILDAFLSFPSSPSSSLSSFSVPCLVWEMPNYRHWHSVGKKRHHGRKPVKHICFIHISSSLKYVWNCRRIPNLLPLDAGLEDPLSSPVYISTLPSHPFFPDTDLPRSVCLFSAAIAFSKGAGGVI